MNATPAPSAPPPSSLGRSKVIALFLWLVFATGLGLQGLAPRLKIQNRAFVMPPSLLLEGNTIRPDAIVQRERTLQGASGLCTMAGALALAFWYRRTLLAAFQGTEIPRSARSL
jgi:hypothetical protein